jgi:hypothetical protein
MTEIKCPHCGQVFNVDESALDSIINQIRNGQFKHDVDKRVSEVESNLKKQHELELDAKAGEIRLKTQEAANKTIRELEENLRKAEAEKERLQSEVNAAEDKKKLAVQEAVKKLETEVQTLRNKADGEEDRRKLAVQEAVKKLEDEVLNLKHNADEEENRRKLAVIEAVNAVEAEKHELESELKSEREKHELVVRQKDSEIGFYKDLKAKMSTKMVGETLEQHCEIQFNQLRATAFRNAYFEKDNDARSGSKGDFIYRENDKYGNEIVSIMFEMKNELDETATKHKNEDFFRELHKDRTEKKCEYAVLVSLLESDSELYNAGIVDVSYKYDKMYVVRPQCFIPIITLLRNAALNAMEYKRELAVVRSQNIDVTNFEDNLKQFKDEFGRNYSLAHDHFDKAIEEIDKTIEHLQKVKKELIGSDNQLRIANNKVDNVSVKKLTKDNPTMRAEFERIRKEKEDNME